MGAYINPPTETKEQFLSRYPKIERLADVTWPAPEGQMYVVLVHNPLFTAAGIIYLGREFLEWRASMGDFRLKIWYLVPLADLLEVSNVGEYLTP